MSDKTNIEWCDSTWNPWEGCQKVGPGCDHCYAETRNARFGGGVAVNWGPGAPRRRTSAANWKKPLQWNAAHDQFFAEHGRRQRVFCASLADVFDNAVDPAWRMDLFSLIAETPNLDWLLLTKRIGNAHAMLDVVIQELSHGINNWSDAPWPNVWIGATVVNQEEADRDIPKLLNTPAVVRFLSMEPLLGPVDLTAAYLPCPSAMDGLGMDPETGAYECCRRCDYTGISNEMGIDWVIVGGESGHGARLMHPNWGRSLRDQCQVASVPFLYKQHGEWLPVCDYYSDDDHARDAALDRPYKLITRNGAEWDEEFDGQPPLGTWIMHKVGKKAAGRLLDGREWNEFPEAGR